MNLQNFKAIATQLDADLDAVFKKHGLQIRKRGATIDSIGGTVSYRVTLVDTNLKDESGTATTPEALYFTAMAHVYGLDPSWLGTAVRLGGSEYRIAGLRNTRGRSPVVIEKNGKTYVSRVDSIINAKRIAA